MSGDGDVSVSPASLTFTAADWSTAQQVEVSAGHDDDSDNDSASVAHTVNDAQSDNAYDGLGIAPVAVTVVDDDAPVTVSVTQLELSEGASATYTVRLDVAPTDDVVIDLAVSDDGDVSVSPASLTFTAADWSTAQQVEVSAAWTTTTR